MPGIAIQDFVAKVRCCSEEDFANVPRVLQLLRQHPIEAKSIEQYLTWDSQRYTRNLIDKTPLFEVMAVCWDVGQDSSIHDHKDQNCWMAVPIGRLLVQNYRVAQQDLRAGACDLQATDVFEMNSSRPAAVDPKHPVHRVFNPVEFGQRAVSVHVYSRPFDSCLVYSDQLDKCGEIKLRYTSEYGMVHQ